MAMHKFTAVTVKGLPLITLFINSRVTHKIKAEFKKEFAKNPSRIPLGEKWERDGCFIKFNDQVFPLASV